MPDEPSARKPWPWEERQRQAGQPPTRPPTPSARPQQEAKPAASNTWGSAFAGFLIGVAATVGVVIAVAILMAVFYGDPEGLSVFHETSVASMLTAGGVWGLLILTALRRR